MVPYKHKPGCPTCDLFAHRRHEREFSLYNCTCSYFAALLKQNQPGFVLKGVVNDVKKAKIELALNSEEFDSIKKQSFSSIDTDTATAQTVEYLIENRPVFMREFKSDRSSSEACDGNGFVRGSGIRNLNLLNLLCKLQLRITRINI